MNLDFLFQNIEFFLFIAFLIIFLYFRRRKLEMQGPFPFLYILMYKTKLGLEKMDRWSKKHPRFYLYLAYLSFFIGTVGMILMFIFMFWQLGFIVENNIQSGGGLVLPIKTEDPSASKIFYVPFWYWLISLFVLAIVHEFAHGVIAQRFNIKIKSSGFAFLGLFIPLLPAAFVEPDEKSMSKKKKWKQIAVLGAGSTSNFIFGVIFLLMWIFLAGPFIDNTMEISEISFKGVDNRSSLNNFNITSGSIQTLNNIEDKEKILDKLRNLSINEQLNVSLITNNITKNVILNPYFENSTNRTMLGIYNLNIELDNKEEYKLLGNTPLIFERILFWLWLLNIGIGMMNLLPLWITDGGKISYLLFSYKFNETQSIKLFNLFSFMSLILIILTLWPSIIFGFLS
jgi:membrane-associated protease RseP (regulator of RpoE activity)